MFESDDDSLVWQKSSFTSTACVEVARHRQGIAVRDSKHPHGGMLIYTPQEWRAFLAGVRNGEFDHLAESP